MPLSKEKQRQWMKAHRQCHVIPSVIPNWVKHPNPYLAGHLAVCPDYNPEHPGDHFDHCPYVNPMLRHETQPHVIPELSCTLYPDGVYRLEDMSLVQPEFCQSVNLYKVDIIGCRNNYSAPQKEQKG